MSARRILLQAALVAVAASPAIAQDAPEASRAVPRQAVERTRPRGDDGGAARAARAPERREPVARAFSPVVRSRPREVAPVAPVGTAPALEQQGGRRSPSAGGGGGSRGGGAGSRGGGGSSSGGSRAGGGGSRGDQGVARPRGGVRNPEAAGSGAPAARAVPRGSVPPPNQGWGNNVGRRYYAGPSGLGYYFYDPWSWYGWGWPAYGAYGNWAGYYGNAWGGYGNAWGGVGNGWGGGPWGGGGYGLYTGPTGWSIGSVRLKVAERDAEVFVDGYYAGVVDDFDGIWQKLRLDDGGYRLEIRKPGFETLVVDLRVQPGRTITYRGTMVPVP